MIELTFIRPLKIEYFIYLKILKVNILKSFSSLKKKKDEKVYNKEYGEIVTEKEKEEMIKIFNKTLNDINRLFKSTFPGCKLVEDDDINKVSDNYKNAKTHRMEKVVLRLDYNYKYIQNKCKNIPEIYNNDFKNTDRKKLNDVIYKLILSKLGFNKTNDMFWFEHKRYKQINIGLGDYSDPTVEVSLIFATDINSKISESTMNYVEEFFKFKKKKKYTPVVQEKPKEENKYTLDTGKPYPVNKVKSDITKIKAEVKQIFNTEKSIKDILDNGLKIATNKYTFEYIIPDKDEEGNEVFRSGDEFVITKLDLWGYKGGNPREILNNTGNHPVYDADNLIRERISKFLEDKFPDYKVDEYGGDWDTSDMIISLN